MKFEDTIFARAKKNNNKLDEKCCLSIQDRSTANQRRFDICFKSLEFKLKWYVYLNSMNKHYIKNTKLHKQFEHKHIDLTKYTDKKLLVRYNKNNASHDDKGNDDDKDREKGNDKGVDKGNDKDIG